MGWMNVYFMDILWMCESHEGMERGIVGCSVVCDLSWYGVGYGLTNTILLGECQEVFVDGKEVPTGFTGEGMVRYSCLRRVNVCDTIA